MKKICIVLSKYNSHVTDKIYESAIKELLNCGIKKAHRIEVPGAFELPVAISRNIRKYDGFIAIGCIVKGETANFDLISSAITNGIMNISINEKKPIGNAILTCLNIDQAEKRLDKGKEAVTAVLKVLNAKSLATNAQSK